MHIDDNPDMAGTAKRALYEELGIPDDKCEQPEFLSFGNSRAGISDLLGVVKVKGTAEEIKALHSDALDGSEYTSLYFVPLTSAASVVDFIMSPDESGHTKEWTSAAQGLLYPLLTREFGEAAVRQAIEVRNTPAFRARLGRADYAPRWTTS